MAVTFVAAGDPVTTPTDLTATSITLDPPGSVQDGEYMVACLTFQAGGSNNDVDVSIPTGWTFVDGANDLGSFTSSRCNVYAAFSTGNEGFQWNYTAPEGANAAGFILTYSNVNTSIPIVGAETGTNTDMGNTTRETDTIVTSAVRMIVAAWSDRSGSTWTSSDNERQTAVASSSVSVFAADRGEEPAGSYSMTATASSSTSVSASVIFALNAEPTIAGLSGTLPVLRSTLFGDTVNPMWAVDVRPRRKQITGAFPVRWPPGRK